MVLDPIDFDCMDFVSVFHSRRFQRFFDLKRIPQNKNSIHNSILPS